MKHILQSNDYIWNIEQVCFKRRTSKMRSTLMWIYTHFNYNGYRRRYYEI